MAKEIVVAIIKGVSATTLKIIKRNPMPNDREDRRGAPQQTKTKRGKLADLRTITKHKRIAQIARVLGPIKIEDRSARGKIHREIRELRIERKLDQIENVPA